MNQPKRRIQIWTMAAVFLLAACAPAAPAATQDPALLEQNIDRSVESTVAAHNAQATQQQASLPTPTPLPTSAPAAGTASTAEPVAELPDVPDSSAATGEPVGALPDAPDETATATQEPGEDYCNLFLESTLNVKPEDIQDLQSQLKVGDTAKIMHHVNLRTLPSLRNRIILVLKPGAQVEILDGPRVTRFGNGTRYTWWQVKIPGGLTGWSAELSVCRQFYFMEPVK
jgi:Bacterial SH3 domain